MRAQISLILLPLALGLAACNQRTNDTELAKLDNEITGNDADPALTSALEDQIMVDPALTQQSNKNAVRPPATPPQAQYPLPAGSKGGSAAGATGSGAPARAAAGTPPSGAVQTAAASDEPGPAGADCASRLNYNPAWARRLPAAFAMLPGARLTEAAGLDASDCRARVVTFTTNEAPQRVLDYYRGRAIGAGYSAEHAVREGDHILAGTARGSDAAYYLILTPRRGGGSDVAMITNGA